MRVPYNSPMSPRSRLVVALVSTALTGYILLGSLLGRGQALSLHVPLLVATVGYLVAIALAWTTIRDR